MQMRLEGHLRLSRWFKQMPRAIEQLATDSIRMAAIAITDAAKGTIASWQMRRYLRFQVRSAKEALVVSGHPGSAAREFGWGLYGPKRAKYAIRPKRAKVLGIANVIGQKKKFKAASEFTVSGVRVSAGYKVWTAPSGTEVLILGRKVMHPGGKGIHWFQRAVEEAQPRIMRLTGKHVIESAVKLY